jgi:uncharacterized protein (DUF1330 family)
VGCEGYEVFGTDNGRRTPINGSWATVRHHAHNLFNVADRDEYLAYSRRSAKEVQAHGGRVVALGKFREAAAGDIKPRTVMILVEWASKAALRQCGRCARGWSAPGAE